MPYVAIENPMVGKTYYDAEHYGVYRYDVFPRGSVLEGQERRSCLDVFDSEEEAREAYPNAELAGGSGYRDIGIPRFPPERDDDGEDFLGEGKWHAAGQRGNQDTRALALFSERNGFMGKEKEKPMTGNYTNYGAQLAEVTGAERRNGALGFLVRPLDNGLGERFGFTAWTDHVALIRPGDWSPVIGAPLLEWRWAYRVSSDTWVRVVRTRVLAACGRAALAVCREPGGGCLRLALSAPRGLPGGTHPERQQGP
jgi:hypothetical protein